MSEQMIERDIPVQGAEEASSFRMISTLGVAGFIAGIVLVGVYMVTLPIIQQNKEQALQEAIYRVLPGCSSYETLILSDGKLVKAEKAAGSKAERIFAGFNSEGKMVGFAIPASNSGFQDLIKLIYGFETTAETIVGFEVLESKETPGLGDKIVKDKAFLANFTALAVEPAVEGTPKGTKTKPNQIETITGATISSKAVIKALQSSLEEWRPAIQKYMQTSGVTAKGSEAR